MKHCCQESCHLIFYFLTFSTFVIPFCVESGSKSDNSGSGPEKAKSSVSAVLVPKHC
jgi:hypothetical protein